MTMPISGRCLCEKIRYKITSPPLSQGICYCYQCQKAGGAYGSPLLVLSKDTFESIQAGLSFCRTRTHDASIVTRYFCKECGSHIFAEISDVPKIMTVKAATLDDFSLFIPDYLVWTREAGKSCVFPRSITAFLEDAPLEVVMGMSLQ